MFYRKYFFIIHKQTSMHLDVKDGEENRNTDNLPVILRKFRTGVDVRVYIAVKSYNELRGQI